MIIEHIDDWYGTNLFIIGHKNGRIGIRGQRFLYADTTYWGVGQNEGYGNIGRPDDE